MKARVLLGVLATLWPFIALLCFAVVDHSFWNDPGDDRLPGWCVCVAVLAAWTGTLPLTAFVWHRIARTRRLVARLALVVGFSVGYSTLYLAVLYMFLIGVALQFDHIFI